MWRTHDTDAGVYVNVAFALYRGLPVDGAPGAVSAVREFRSFSRETPLSAARYRGEDHLEVYPATAGSPFRQLLRQLSVDDDSKCPVSGKAKYDRRRSRR